MTSTAERTDWLDAVTRLKVSQRAGKVAPHKPLLLLLAVARLRKGERRLAFNNVEHALSPLLKHLGPPGSGRPAVELPYWRLQSDGLWRVEGAETVTRKDGRTVPTAHSLRTSHGALVPALRERLEGDEAFGEQLVQAILERYFDERARDEVREALGLSKGA